MTQQGIEFREIEGEDGLFVFDSSFPCAINKRDDHLFSEGETCKLVGLVDNPEFNGQEIKIKHVRQDYNGERTYYIDPEHDLHDYIDWIFEKRFEKII